MHHDGGLGIQHWGYFQDQFFIIYIKCTNEHLSRRRPSYPQHCIHKNGTGFPLWAVELLLSG